MADEACDMADVVILGAGLAGLSAALSFTDMRAAGTIAGLLRIVVLEARDRVGGRLYAAPGTGVDVGGAWCWYRSHTKVPELAKRFGVESFRQRDEGKHVLDMGSMRGVQTTTEPLDASKMRFKGGSYAITEAMAQHLRGEGVEILLGHRARRVALDGPAAPLALVEAEGPDGARRRFNAKAVLVALPPRIALPPMLEWSPHLDVPLQKVMRTTPTWMADTTKVLATYKKPFWREAGYSGDGMSQSGPVHQLYDSCGGEKNGDGASALCGFIYSDSTREEDDSGLKKAALEQLGRMFGPQATEPESFTIHRWGADELTAGQGGGRGGGHDAMGAPQLRKPVALEGLKAPPRVWQCSAETDARHAGVMEGALMSARRAAKDVVDSGVLNE